MNLRKGKSLLMGILMLLLLTSCSSKPISLPMPADSSQDINEDASNPVQLPVETNNSEEGKNTMTDLQIVKQRLFTSLLGSSSQARAYMDTITPEGRWEDIDYKDTSRNGFKPAEHLKRLKSMAQAYRDVIGGLCEDQDLKEKILSGLAFWFQNDFQSSNWWYNEIGTPIDMGDILLLMGDAVPPEVLSKGVDILKRGDWTQKNWTGQNLVWGVWNNLRRGCLENDEALIDEAVKRMAQEIRLSPIGEEGIQSDFSFHQHGAILYSGGYGRGFTQDCTRLAYLVRNTRFQLSQEKLSILSSYILDGQQWMIRGTTFDYSALGREISRRRASSAGWYGDMCSDMLDIENLPREDEFQALAQRTQGKQDDFDGNRHFWRSDFMTHHRKDYYTSVKMVSTRTIGTESGNDEGLQNYHLFDGCTYIMRTGREYEDIFPIWDWKRIPGTTAEQTEGGLPLVDWGKGARGTTTFVGGVTDGLYGAASMDLAKDQLRAKKSWFFFDREFVALGADIQSPSNNPVYTSINQCFMNGNVLTSDGSQSITQSKGSHILKNPLWVFHDKIGYVFPEPANVQLKNEAQSGSWYDINRSGDKTQQTEDVFSLWFDHGSSVNGGTYSYIVVPEITVNHMDAYAHGTPIRILSNTPQLQAVWHEELQMLQSVFRIPGEASVSEGLHIKADKPCLLLFQDQGEFIEVAVSNPENVPLDVQVTINLQLSGEGCTWSEQEKTSTLSFTLPDGNYAGQSVVKKFKKI